MVSAEAIKKNTVDLVLHETKRTCEDYVEIDRPSKKMRVSFAENSSMRLCEIPAPGHEDVAASCEDDGTFAHEASISDEHSAPSDCLAMDSVTDIQTATKTLDGPSSVTLATNAIIRALIGNRSTNSTQVADLLREAAAAIPSPPMALPADPLTDADACAVLLQLACPGPAPSHAPLCLSVLDRLRVLSDRIEARGKASILPCTTNLQRSFLPGMRFLMSSVEACVAPGEQQGLKEQG
jgi:hypothetical protein